jgi:hypothetical protein
MKDAVSDILITEQNTRELLLHEISSSFIWLNIYNNSYILGSLARSIFDSAGLPQKSLQELSISHFLIYCIEQNICENLEKILAGFNFSVQRVQEENRSTIHGSINWGVTLQRRIATGYIDRTLFITANNTRDNDTLPNQLIRFLLTKIIVYSNIIVGNSSGNLSHEDAWINQVIKQANDAKRIISHPKLQAVTLIHKLTFRHIDAAMSSRIVYYRTAAKCAKLYYDIFIMKSAESIQKLIMSRVLAPVDTPTIYEFAVLFKTLECFENCLKEGDSKKYVAISSSEQTVFEYKLQNTLYRVYYQAVPIEVVSKQYSNCLKSHGFIGSSLRPDIFVTSENLSGRKQRIIEVKYSLRSAYTYEGLKDVLAYLYDFPEVDNSDDGCIILATYLNTPKIRKVPNKVWISGYNQLGETILALIRKMG